MNRYWISWEEPEGDYRPIAFPAPEWWCTGYGKGFSTICALVEASSKDAAQQLVSQLWKPRAWRFVNEVAPDWRPPEDRFPIGGEGIAKPWSEE